MPKNKIFIGLVLIGYIDGHSVPTIMNHFQFSYETHELSRHKFCPPMNGNWGQNFILDISKHKIIWLLHAAFLENAINWLNNLLLQHTHSQSVLPWFLYFWPWADLSEECNALVSGRKGPKIPQLLDPKIWRRRTIANWH